VPRTLTAILPIITILGVLMTLTANAQTQTADRSWIETSNNYTKQLLTVEMKHHPESGSRQGLSEYDKDVSQPTLADEDAQRQETEAVLAKFKSAVGEQKQKEVKQDLEIIIRRVELGFKQEDFERAHKVPFSNASGEVYEGLRILLDDQTPDARRPAAVVRIRKYAGLKPGYKPLTEILKQRVQEQMAKPGVVYPAKVEIETELGRN